VSLAEIQATVDDLVRDKDQVITSVQRDTAIADALQRYSADAPRVIVEDVASAGGQVLPLPLHWIDGQSEIHGIEYPLGSVPPNEILPTAIHVTRTPTGPSLIFVFSPTSGEDVRLTYTGAHVVDVTTNTIPNRHRRALCALAAADLCGQLSADYATEGAPTIGADSADHMGKTERYRNRARDLRAEYTSLIGNVSERTKPASVDVALPRRDALGGRPLFHPPTQWPR